MLTSRLFGILRTFDKYNHVGDQYVLTSKKGVEIAFFAAKMAGKAKTALKKEEKIFSKK